MEMRKFVAPEFVFGDNTRFIVSQYIINIGMMKPLIVTDKNIKKQYWYKEIINDLLEHGIAFDEFSGVTINPKDYECIEGAKAFSIGKCDAIVAIGGGSVIDSAKGIGILVANRGEIVDYEGVDMFSHPIPPIICLPTTSGSAADVSQFAIITNSEERYKMAHISKMLVPDVSLLDPIVTLTMSYEVSIDTALDTLAHAIESYVSPIASFVTEPLALSAIERVVKYLPLLINDLDNLEYRTEIMKASLEAGLSFSNASLGLIHALAHSLGGYLELSHGELNGKLLKYVVKLNYESTDKYRDIETVFSKYGLSACGNRLDQQIESLLSLIDIEHGTYDIMLKDAEIERIAKMAMKDPCIFTNPKDLELSEVVTIIEQVFKREN